MVLSLYWLFANKIPIIRLFLFMPSGILFAGFASAFNESFIVRSIRNLMAVLGIAMFIYGIVLIIKMYQSDTDMLHFCGAA